MHAPPVEAMSAKDSPIMRKEKGPIPSEIGGGRPVEATPTERNRIPKKSRDGYG